MCHEFKDGRAFFVVKDMITNEIVWNTMKFSNCILDLECRVVVDKNLCRI